MNGMISAGPDVGEADLRLAEQRVVGRDRDVAHHHQLAAAAEAVTLDGGDHRLAHVPRRHLERDVVGERLVPGQRVAAPRGAGRAGADVVAGGEAPALGAQHHHAGGRIGVGLVQALDEQALELGADRVELVARG